MIIKYGFELGGWGIILCIIRYLQIFQQRAKITFIYSKKQKKNLLPVLKYTARILHSQY